MSLDPAEHYRRLAATCVEIAQDIRDPASKAALLNMAQHWLVLADQATKNARNAAYSVPDGETQQQQQPQPDRE